MAADDDIYDVLSASVREWVVPIAAAGREVLLDDMDYLCAFSSVASSVVADLRLPILVCVLVVKFAGHCREDSVPRDTAFRMSVTVHVTSIRPTDA